MIFQRFFHMFFPQKKTPNWPSCCWDPGPHGLGCDPWQPHSGLGSAIVGNPGQKPTRFLGMVYEIGFTNMNILFHKSGILLYTIYQSDICLFQLFYEIWFKVWRGILFIFYSSETFEGVIPASWWHRRVIWDLHLLSALLGKDQFILGTNLYVQIEVFPLVWYTRAFHWSRKYAGSRLGESSKNQLKIGSIWVGKYRKTIHFGGHNITYIVNEQSATQPKNQVKVRGKIVPPHPKT